MALKIYQLGAANRRIEELEKQLATKTATDRAYAAAMAPVLATAAPNSVAKLDAKFENAYDHIFGAAAFESLKARSTSEADLRSRAAHQMYAAGVCFPGWEADVARVEAKLGTLKLNGLAKATAEHKREALQRFLAKSK